MVALSKGYAYVQTHNMKDEKYVVVQFYPCLKFCFPCFWAMVKYDDEFEAKRNEI